MVLGIGGGVTINPSIKIGENSMIGAGSVVTKNISDNVVAVGNPCCVIRGLRKNKKYRTSHLGLFGIFIICV